MNMIDNRYGFGAALEAKFVDYDRIRIELSDNKFYGETPILDCPPDQSICQIWDKFAVMFTGSSYRGKIVIPTAMPELPVHKVKSISTWGTQQVMYRNEFIGFEPKTRYGKRQAIFQLNPYQADYIPMIEFFDSKFIDVKDGAAAYIMEPNPEWATVIDCGNYPCSGPPEYSFQLLGHQIQWI